MAESNEHIPFPKIRDFNNFIKEITLKGDNRLIPITSTIKIHGSNAGIIVKNESIICQSRNRILTLEHDNCGFFSFVHSRIESINTIIAQIRGITNCKPDDTIKIFGEICGSNIQKNVALCQLPKMFVIFAVKINDEWNDLNLFENVKDEQNNIYNILRAPTHELIVDTNNIKKTFNELIELTTQVNNQCPFAKTFGVDGIGEGLVFRCKNISTSRLWFKVKGEDHCATKTKVLKNSKIDSFVTKELFEFTEMTVTDVRLNQGIEYLNEMNFDIIPKNTSVFIKWIVDDIFDEDADKIDELNITESIIKREIAKKASNWFKEYIINTLAK